MKRTNQAYFPSLLVLLSAMFASATFKVSLPQASAEELLSEDQLFQKFIERATSAYKNKRYEAAIKHFEGALMVRSNPNIHWNLSVCYYKLRQYKKALSHANEYLSKGSPSQKMRAKVESRKQEILRALQQSLLVEQTPKRRDKVTINRRPPPITQPPKPDRRSAKPKPQWDGLSSESSGKPRSQGQWDTTGNTERVLYREGPSYTQAIVWASVSAALLATSFGLHSYGDSVWEARPDGGGDGALSAKRSALLYSWVGDGVMALGVTSLAIAIHSYLNVKEQSAYSSCPSCANTTEHRTVSGVPTFHLLQSSQAQNDSKESVHGGVLGWRVTF